MSTDLLNIADAALTRCARPDGILDTRSVVPYDVYLLAYLDCHVNVEVRASLRAVKYLYTCACKGPDRACLERARNEIEDFLDCRYVGAPEAAWRLLGFPLHGRSHPVERLPVHLPQEQHIQFQEGREDVAANAALQKNTKLEAWFVLNARAREEKDFPNANLVLSLRYPEVTQHFTWNAKTSTWKHRERRSKHGSVIGRMSYVKPTSGELFYLRLLLLHLRGEDATSWVHIRSASPLGGPASFQQRARELGLLHDDAEAVAALSEACRITRSTVKLCEIFAQLVVWMEVNDKVAFWQEFLRLLHEHHANTAVPEAYKCVQEHLLLYKCSMADFGVPPPTPESDVSDKEKEAREYGQ